MVLCAKPRAYVMNATATLADAPITETLSAIVGSAHVLTSHDDRRFYGSDIFRGGELPIAVVLPGSVAELQDIVRVAARHRLPVTVRGGGASYTDGYNHSRPGGITIGTDRLTAIDIDTRKNIVTVEPGVTWAALHESLKARGLRTPFWGPFSGLAATIGGSISQNSISHGPGVSAESVVALDIVTGTGDLLRTASGGSANGEPFFRHFGPDLTGLFTGDCGALGIKAAITLKLVARHDAFAALSFSFTSFTAMHTAMAEIARQGLDDENFGLDAALQQGQIGRNDSVSAKAEIAKSVMKSAGSVAGGLKSLAKMAVAGDRALMAADYAVHYIADGIDQPSAEAKAAAIRAIGRRHGTEIANSVPVIVRGMPFAPLTNILGPKGERWCALHGLFAHDAVDAFHAAITTFWNDNRLQMDAHGVYTGAMFMAVGSSAFVYEPAFYWPETRDIVHDRMVPANHLTTVDSHPAAPEATALVARLKHDVIELMHAHGAAHLQIGKTYPYLTGRNPAAVALLRAIKAELDPHDILNPGALGL